MNNVERHNASATRGVTSTGKPQVTLSVTCPVTGTTHTKIVKGEQGSWAQFAIKMTRRFQSDDPNRRKPCLVVGIDSHRSSRTIGYSTTTQRKYDNDPFNWVVVIANDVAVA